MDSFGTQIRKNMVALISLFIAIIALSYESWRHEATEKNFNLRVASFEVLKQLEKLQVVVNFAQFEPDNPQGNSFYGWEHISMIADLSTVLPQPIPKQTEQLVSVWKNNSKTLKTNEESGDKITKEIDESRQTVLKVISSLK